MTIAVLNSIGNSKIPSLEVQEKSLDQPILIETKENKLKDYWINGEMSFPISTGDWFGYTLDGHTAGEVTFSLYRPSPHHEPHYHAGIKRIPINQGGFHSGET